MSLSSKELNYLIWRYLEESGYELSAYAFNKQSKCSGYEENNTEEILKKISPGFLVSLVQKGILYSLAESDVTDQKVQPELLTFFGSLLQQEKDDMADIEDAKMAVDGDSEQVVESAKKQPLEPFVTKKLEADITYDESLMSRWHPSTNVLAYIKIDSSLLISVINNGKISETASLKSVGPETFKNLSCVSWSPLGNLLTTANTAGDLCSWSPDGHLRNVVRGIVKGMEDKKVIMEIQWSPSGQYFLTQDTVGSLSLWNGTNLDIIQEITADGSGGICWLDDHKFAVSCKDFTIKVHSIENGTVKSIGELRGHQGLVTNLEIHHSSRRLASYSSTDNSVKVWSSSSSTSSEAVTLDSKARIAPLVLLEWLENGSLVGVSLNGVIRVWDPQGIESCTNIFKDDTAYNFEDTSTTKGSGSLVYAADLSSNGQYLAIGDNKGRVSIWTGTTSDPQKLTCKGVFDAQDLQDEQTKGISYITWDKASNYVSVSYNGTSSIILQI